MTALGELWPYILLVLVGVLPNEIWRLLGVLASRGIAEDSELIIWVRAVATAILGGVVVKIVIFAPGALAGVPMTARLTAIAAGVLAFLMFRGSVFAGVAAGCGTLVAGAWLMGG
jgi:branched-subunit amino acid transport protein AzlD